MLAHAEIHRSIRGMSLTLAEDMRKRTHRAHAYDLTEREKQYQFEISGSVGSFPAETDLTLAFDVTFYTDHGNQRESSLDRPQVRIGWEFDYAPPGFQAHAHVSKWAVDDDFNITGAVIHTCFHSPLAQFEQLDAQKARFKGALHVAFQGWCHPNDPDGELSAGGNTDFAGLS